MCVNLMYLQRNQVQMLVNCVLLVVQVTSLKLITICIDLTNSECVSMFVVISE